MPLLEFGPSRWVRRVCAAALAVALALQSAVFWDYAALSDRTVGKLMRLDRAVGRGNRIAYSLNRASRPFRANPLLHAEMMLGIGTDNIFWTNYQADAYYFPVHFREEIDHPRLSLIQGLNINHPPLVAELRSRCWDELLRRHHAKIDEMVVWGTDAGIDAAINRWFELIFEDGEARLLRHRERPRAPFVMRAREPGESMLERPASSGIDRGSSTSDR